MDDWVYAMQEQLEQIEEKKQDRKRLIKVRNESKTQKEYWEYYLEILKGTLVPVADQLGVLYNAKRAYLVLYPPHKKHAKVSRVRGQDEQRLGVIEGIDIPCIAFGNDRAHHGLLMTTAYRYPTPPSWEPLGEYHCGNYKRDRYVLGYKQNALIEANSEVLQAQEAGQTVTMTSLKWLVESIEQLTETDDYCWSDPTKRGFTDQTNVLQWLEWTLGGLLATVTFANTWEWRLGVSFWITAFVTAAFGTLVDHYLEHSYDGEYGTCDWLRFKTLSEYRKRYQRNNQL